MEVSDGNDGPVPDWLAMIAQRPVGFIHFPAGVIYMCNVCNV